MLRELFHTSAACPETRESASVRTNKAATHGCNRHLLWRVRFLQRLRFIEVAIGHAHESRGPLVLVAGVNALESFFHVAGIEPNQRILANFSAVDGFDSDLVDSAFAALFFLCPEALAGK